MCELVFNAHCECWEHSEYLLETIETSNEGEHSLFMYFADCEVVGSAMCTSNEGILRQALSELQELWSMLWRILYECWEHF